MFLDHTRNKFVGFQVKNDQESMAGLPQPIHEGVKVLKQVRKHLYLRIKILFFNFHDVMKTVGGAKIP